MIYFNPPKDAVSLRSFNTNLNKGDIIRCEFTDYTRVTHIIWLRLIDDNITDNITDIITEEVDEWIENNNLSLNPNEWDQETIVLFQLTFG